MEIITRIDPLTYGIDGMRAVLINGGKFGIGLDLCILSFLALALLAIGSLMFEKIQA